MHRLNNNNRLNTRCRLFKISVFFVHNNLEAEQALSLAEKVTSVFYLLLLTNLWLTASPTSRAGERTPVFPDQLKVGAVQVIVQYNLSRRTQIYTHVQSKRIEYIRAEFKQSLVMNCVSPFQPKRDMIPGHIHSNFFAL